MAIAFAACSQSPGGGSAATETVLHLAADDLRFDPVRLAVPVGTAFEIELDNRERGIPHNVAVYRDAAASDALARGEVSIGPATTRTTVAALPAGAYVFRCDVHRPGMTGTLDVGG